jgi:uncharacterized protein with HEPN domain
VTGGRGRNVDDRLRDILRAVARINAAERAMTAAESAHDDSAEALAMDAILYNLVVIGEAVNALPAPTAEAAPDVPWREIVGMRNHLAHEYFRVSADVIRRTIDAPLTKLHDACERLIAQHDEDTGV